MNKHIVKHIVKLTRIVAHNTQTYRETYRETYRSAFLSYSGLCLRASVINSRPPLFAKLCPPHAHTTILFLCWFLLFAPLEGRPSLYTCTSGSPSFLSALYGRNDSKPQVRTKTQAYPVSSPLNVDLASVLVRVPVSVPTDAQGHQPKYHYRSLQYSRASMNTTKRRMMIQVCKLQPPAHRALSLTPDPAQGHVLACLFTSTHMTSYQKPGTHVRPRHRKKRPPRTRKPTRARARTTTTQGSQPVRPPLTIPRHRPKRPHTSVPP
jgi:hypothetical protein